MIRPLSQVPSREPAVDAGPSLFRRAWLNWFAVVKIALDAATLQIQRVRLTAQAASIAATAFATQDPLQASLYRVSWYTRVMQAATTSSSLTITIAWTEGGVACSTSGAALTGNTVDTQQSGALLIRADAGTTITYAVTYASVGGTVMQFAADLVLEQVPS